MKSESLAKILKTTDVIFDEKKHTYTKPNSEMYTGCTTISDAWDKSFFLGPWYAKEMAAELKHRIQDVGIMFADNPNPQKSFEAIVDECKGAAKRVSEQAKADGTAAHDWVASSIAAEFDPAVAVLPMPESTAAQNAINAYSQWKNANKPFWLASEEVVASDEHRIAGKLDGIAVINGITYLVDFKTSGQLSASYLLQCAGYDVMLREMGLTVMGYLIIRIPKDGSSAETLTIHNQTDMQFFRETFLKQREAHRFYVYAESKFKDASGKMMVDEPVKARVKKVKVHAA